MVLLSLYRITSYTASNDPVLIFFISVAFVTLIKGFQTIDLKSSIIFLGHQVLPWHLRWERGSSLSITCRDLL
jgi:hypothetical protein